jgi:hypothetical protein
MARCKTPKIVGLNKQVERPEKESLEPEIKEHE